MCVSVCVGVTDRRRKAALVSVCAFVCIFLAAHCCPSVKGCGTDWNGLVFVFGGSFFERSGQH